MIGRILGIVGLALLAAWWWGRKQWVESPLQQYYQESSYKQYIGMIAQQAVAQAQPPVATWGQGWGTALQINNTNPNPYVTTPSVTTFNPTNLNSVG
jgi:hypothetical protein